MSTERLKVLEMLNAGTITIEQANQLLEALGERTSDGPVIADGQTIRIDPKTRVVIAISAAAPKASDQAYGKARTAFLEKLFAAAE